MSTTVPSAETTAVVLVDYAVGFANLFRSHSVAHNANAASALAATARGFGVPLLVTHGQDGDPPGPVYPGLLEVIGDTPVLRRQGEFDAFDNPAFAAAVQATGRRHLAIAGLMTEGCVLYTVLGALRRGYEVSLVVDASAGETKEAHDVAVQRMVQAGVVPTTWLSLATGFQRSWDNIETVGAFAGLIAQYSPQLGMNMAAHAAHAAHVAQLATAAA